MYIHHSGPQFSASEDPDPILSTSRPHTKYIHIRKCPQALDLTNSKTRASICVCMCACTYMYVYVHVYVCMYMYVYVHVCVCTCMSMYMYV